MVMNRLKVNGGAERDRTADLVIANDALSQLSYSPVPICPAGNASRARQGSWKVL
jgi:hypothetical protein